MPQQARHQENICCQLLSNPVDEKFIKTIVTCDEKWASFCNPASQEQWIDRAQPCVKQYRFKRKSMLYIWRNCEETCVIWISYQCSVSFWTIWCYFGWKIPSIDKLLESPVAAGRESTHCSNYHRKNRTGRNRTATTFSVQTGPCIFWLPFV